MKKAGEIEQANLQKKQEIKKGLIGEQILRHVASHAIGRESYETRKRA